MSTTAHGAYTQAKGACGSIKRNLKAIDGNIKALLAAGPLEEDPQLIAALDALAKQMRELEPEFEQIGEKTMKLAEKYLKGKVTKKDVSLTYHGKLRR